MKVLLVICFLAPLVLGWKQCGAPSERIVKISDIQVDSAPTGDDHWVKVVVRGSTTKFIPASAVLHSSARLGAIRIPLQDNLLGVDINPGPVEYVFERVIEAPSGVVTHVKLSVEDQGKTVLCVHDLEVDLD